MNVRSLDPGDIRIFTRRFVLRLAKNTNPMDSDFEREAGSSSVDRAPLRKVECLTTKDVDRDPPSSTYKLLVM